MNEEFLYYVWKYKIFTDINLQTSDAKEVSILKGGIHNKNSGPDFLNAQVKIDHQLWAGNVEMHVKSSDWYLHKHEEDASYDAVILHVVWEHDVDVFMKNNKPLPTLELKNFVSKELLENYNSLVYHQQKFIPCENQLTTIDEFLLNNLLERLYFERLEHKSTFIKELLLDTNADFEAVLFQLLAKNFGLKVNGEPFLQLATSMDFSVVRKERFDLEQLTALLFGQAGFLEEDLEEHYYQLLKEKYRYLKHKHKLNSISKNAFQFFRMRPQNFPTIRIAQLASLLYAHQNIFSKLMSINKKEDFYDLFSFEVDAFWKTHFTFESDSKKSPKKLTKSFVDLIIINTIIPLKFVYLQSRGEVSENEIMQLIKQVSSEKNSIISNFSALEIKAKNAMESQALIQLKNNYCTKKRCLQCAIGNSLLRK
ncbi:hypothetical protein LPB03_05290 [Polaribacter vadi]|uniref:DUF2851 domain-containing protein n=2 Tax=Polaribacter vadi TaxID=1774273 RepID=A0A1B8TWT1_9FLAO|nr:DUF2851 family protein [Polaribacter vadi]AOW16912.1 hypothetical protein LPB03_05290 [Polaribacter vadi]OBY64181.1 hypothetical protein LPB3_07205 [Polaribacter vadi]